MISACMTVSVRELRTAVREWACCTGLEKQFFVCLLNYLFNPLLHRLFLDHDIIFYF